MTPDTKKKLIIASPNAAFAEQLKKHFERHNFKVIEIIVVLEHLIETLEMLDVEGKKVDGIILSSDIGKKLNDKQLELLSDVLLTIRERYSHLNIVVLANEKQGHPFLAELVHMGIYNIFVKDQDSKGLNVPLIIDTFENPFPFSAVARFRNADSSIQWRKTLVVGGSTINIRSIPEKTLLPQQTLNKTKTEDNVKDSIDDIAKGKQGNDFEFDVEDLLELDIPSLSWDKVTIQDRVVGTVVISVIGTNRGVGVTHTAIMLAHYISTKGHKVAIVEANDSTDFTEIEYVYEGGNGFKNHKPEFTIQEVVYYKSMQIEMTQIMNMGFDYIILDIGEYRESEWIAEFLRSHLHLVVASGSVWKQKDIYEFSKIFGTQDQSKWRYCIPLTEKIVINDIRNDLKEGEVFNVPFHPDPHKKNKETHDALAKLLKDYLPERKAAIKDIINGTIISMMCITIAILVYLLMK